ncbi:MAG: hypothetical protein ACYCZZ_02460 [Minisyncoccota bacterium]
MTRPFLTIRRASVSVFKKPIYAVIAVGSALVFFGMYLIVPTLLVPGNSLSFELALISPSNYVLLATLALMTGMLAAFELFSLRRSRANGFRSAGKRSVGFVASITGGVLAAASCGCSAGILLGVVGLGGGTLFATQNQTSIVVVLLGIVLIGLYFSARRVAGICSPILP